jgi:hypothetical protein
MLTTNEDLEALLGRLNKSFTLAGDGVYLIAMGSGQPPAALRIEPPVLVLQVQVGRLPRGGDAQMVSLLERLLELNASGLLHAAFALEAGNIVLTSALEVESLDPNELEAVLADMDIALSEHVPALSKLADRLGLE